VNLKQLNTKEAYEPQMDWEKPSKDVDPFSDAGWEKYRSFKHGSATADKMAKDEDERGNKRFGKYDDKGNWHGVSTSDPAQWKELIARGYKLQESWKTPYFVKEAVEENIYAKNKEDPMNPEVLIQGFGRLMLNQIEDDLVRKFESLADMAKKKDWDGIDYRLNQSGVVQAFIEAIRDTYEELEQIRRRGGMNSRGIKQR